MTKLQAFFTRHKGLAAGFIFFCCILFGGCIFPVYNLTRLESNYSPWIHLYLAMTIFVFWGNIENAIFPKVSLLPIAALNFGLTAGGMLFRYLLEFGEVSNTYNFTAPNIALHMITTVTVSTLAWYWAKQKKKQNNREEPI